MARRACRKPIARCPPRCYTARYETPPADNATGDSPALLGTRTQIVVPPWSLLTTCISPPTMCARSSMLTSPRPPPFWRTASTSNPRPSSVTVSSTCSPNLASETESRRARPCDDAVSERFLSNAKQTHRDVWAQTSEVALAREVHLNRGTASRLRCSTSRVTWRGRAVASVDGCNSCERRRSLSKMPSVSCWSFEQGLLGWGVLNVA